MTAKEKREKEFEELFNRAHAAGMTAGKVVTPRPMVVQQHANMLDDKSPVVYRDIVDEGVCGFAWILVRPGGSSFGRWLKATKRANNHYYGGMSIWVDEFGQSMTRKEKYAEAFAHVLQTAGINARADSRMD
jgi:hypothetical protein